MEQEIFFSFLIPTFNAERTLEQALKAIRKQDFDQQKIEILVVDGGSTDNTLAIAKKYKAKIIDNPERLPEPAKRYGMLEAKGRYLCVMGADEILHDINQLKKRYKFFTEHPEVHCMLMELIAPDNYEPLCKYLNAVGDPFTCFVYKTYGKRADNLKKNLINKDNEKCIFKFAPDDITPIGDGGAVIDFKYVKEHYPEEMFDMETSMIFDMLLRDTQYLVMLQDDWVLHLSKADFKTYIKKLKFRVINNIHNIKGSGYAYRAKTKPKLNRRKYLYPIYCLTIIWPLIDSFRMIYNFKSPVFMIHFVFTYYVMFEIIIQYFKKILGKKSIVNQYG